MRRTRPAALLCSLALALPAHLAHADEPAVYELRLTDHHFVPETITLPAGKPTVLRITNSDDTTEEFDSSALHTEKLIVAGHYATVRLPPLAPGQYPFMGEFHPQTAHGTVIAK